MLEKDFEDTLHADCLPSSEPARKGESMSDTMFCPKCGSKVLVDHRYCASCGSKLDFAFLHHEPPSDPNPPKRHL